MLVQQSADLAEGLSVTLILLLYMSMREWRLTLLLVGATVVPLGLETVVGWSASH